jgi:DNA polymerase III epsilon subunit-like protein
MRPLVFVDTETTGLDPRRHEVYEISMTKVTSVDYEPEDAESRDYWIEPRQLQHAESGALQVGRFYERRDKLDERVTGNLVNSEELRVLTAMEIARFTEGCHLVGAQVHFDAGFLNAFLRQNGACPAWHHRLIDVESLAMAVLVGEDESWSRPQSLSEICEAFGIPRESHDAKTDCEAAHEAFFTLMRLAERRQQVEERGTDGEDQS